VFSLALNYSLCFEQDVVVPAAELGNPILAGNGDICSAAAAVKQADDDRLASCKVKCVKLFCCMIFLMINKAQLVLAKLSPILIGIMCRPAAGLEGAYRFVLGGGEMITIRFQPSDVMVDCPPSLAKMTLQAQLSPGEVIQLQANSVASKWADVAALVLEQDMDACNEAGELACEEFTDAMEELKARDPSKGICIRWILAASEDGSEVNLVLQALPCSASSIKASPILQEDNVAAVILDTLPMAFYGFDGTTAVGPVPVLFSNNPEETAVWARNNLEATFRALQILNAKLATVEALNAGQAAEYVKQPRPGVSTKPLVRDWSSATPPDPKRARCGAADFMSSAGEMPGSFNKFIMKLG
jgi:hypothetical protein